MTITFPDVENMIEESSSLFECYLERIFESKNMNDLISASHWYTDAVFNMLTYPRHR